MKKYAIQKEFAKYIEVPMPIYKCALPISNLILAVVPFCIFSNRSVKVKHKWLKSFDGKKFKVLIYEPVNSSDNAPCLIYYHGGGFVLKAYFGHYSVARKYARSTPCKVVFVDYRLAPFHPFPTPARDCFEAYKWVIENAEALKIDKDRIAVDGDSAGGNLAASVAMYALDHYDVQPCFQMLIYPVIDRRMITESMKLFDDTPIWDSKLSKKMWDWYLPKVTEEELPYVSFLEAPSLKDLPEAYIETAEFDCLRDEGIAYYNALRNAGVKAELHKTKGTIHGYDIEQGNATVQGCLKRRLKRLQKAFEKEN